MWEALKQLYHRLGSPKWFFLFGQRYLPFVWISAAFLILVGLIWGLAFAPIERLQGNSYRIMYIHVPAAAIAQSGYWILAISGLVTLIWRMKMADLVAKAVAPVGASFCLLAFLTGAIWGKPTWGVWFVLDARIVSVMVLFFLYVGIIALHSAIDNSKQAANAGALLAVVGVINLPIIKYSVEWWNTVHQSASISFSGKLTIDSSMLIPLILSTIGFYLLFLGLVTLRTMNHILTSEYRTRWVCAWLKGEPLEAKLKQTELATDKGSSL